MRSERLGILTTREIILRLTSKQRQRQKDTEREDECLQYDPAFVETRNYAYRICLQARESCQEDQVHGIALSLPECEEHEAYSAEQADPHHPRVALDPVSVAIGEEGDGGERSRGE